MSYTAFSNSFLFLLLLMMPLLTLYLPLKTLHFVIPISSIFIHQVHIFLQSTAKNPHKINQSTQYDSALSSKPLQSVAVNTGASLLSDTTNATFSKSTEQQTEAVDKTEERGCRFCKW